MDPGNPVGALTFLFTDIEGSTSLWEQDSLRMRDALAQHNALARAAVEAHRGTLVKLTGDGVYAVFVDSLDALNATLDLQRSLTDPAATAGVLLPVRCGLHIGDATASDDDYVGASVNRAARIMGAAHGGQILMSQAVADAVDARLPGEVSLRDLGSVWLRDIPTPQHIYQAVHPGLRAAFPALRSLADVPNNLPQQPTPFVGREQALADVTKQLLDSRLLTLVGIGGLGKTRLSLEVGGRLLEQFLDGVWFVDLASLSDPALVPQSIAFVLGVKEEAGRPVADALVKFVRERRLLLILDNCEHVGNACATIVSELMRAGPQLKVLATSREPLHMTGEALYPLSPLTVPDQSRTTSLAALSQFEGIRLFCDRAKASLPGFVLNDANAAAVIDICRRLDGLPLALELAAARVCTLPVETIAKRLDDRFRLLKGGDRTRLPRQQTLAALIDWSYELLNARERALLLQLSVFAGGFTLEAAESVGSRHGDDADVLDTLIQLVEKSLVSLEADHYRQLETVRQYAQQRLAQSGGESAARDRHLLYYVGLAERARPELVGPAQSAWLARFDFERENFLTAHAWCDHASDGALLGLRLVAAIRLYWFNRGLLGLGHRVTLEAVNRKGAEARTPVRCGATFVAGQFSFFLGRYAEAVAHLEESLSIAREAGDIDHIARALTLLGVTCIGHADLATARGYLEEALALARNLGNKVRFAGALNAMAELHRTERELDAAERLYEESLAIRRELGDRDAIAIDLLNLTVLGIGREQGERARHRLHEACAIAQELRSKKLGQAVLDAASGLAAYLGQAEISARFHGASAAQMDIMGLQREPAVDAFLAPFVEAARQALDGTGFAAAVAAGRCLSYETAMAQVEAWLAI